MGATTPATMRLKLSGKCLAFLLLVMGVCHGYQDGTSLGGWLVMEAWLFPNTLLMQAAPPGVGVQQKQEWDYINRMRLRGIDAIGSMHQLWNSYVCEDLLDIEAPCQRLLDIKAAGVKHVRIPVGWWIAEPPTEVPSEYAKTASTAYTNRDKGYTKDGFVSGGVVYLEKLLKLLKQAGMHAYLDMHALPGGAVKQMGYTGKFYNEAQFFDGSVQWSNDGNTSSLPPANSTFLRQGVQALWWVADWIATQELSQLTSGVITAMAPWNEALLNDNEKAIALQTVFTLKIVPQLRAKLPAGMDVILNWFNVNPGFWANWMLDHQATLGPNTIVDVHVYHAFDANAYAQGCPQCSSSAVALTNLLCKSCSLDQQSATPYVAKGHKTIVGEWSLGTCNMYGQNPAVIADTDYLYALYAASKSAWRAADLTGDYFWSAFVRNDHFDPTLYNSDGNGSRAAVLSLLEMYEATPSWVTANPYQQPPTDYSQPDYLTQWSLWKLATTNTTAGHRIALPVSDSCDALDSHQSMCVTGTCEFTPATHANFTGALEQAKHQCNPEIACVANPGSSPELLQKMLEFVCSSGAPIDCGPINTGGAHFLPNTLLAHADWAFDQWYQAHRDSSRCYLQGAAYFPQCV